jgi:hypothetical protein
MKVPGRFNDPVGFDAAVENPGKTSQSAGGVGGATQNPKQVPGADPVAAFVACLTAEQRMVLAALLPLGRTDRTPRPRGAERAGPG